MASRTDEEGRDVLKEHWYSVSIEAGGRPLTDTALLADLADVLAAQGADGPAVGTGGLVGGPQATFGILLGEPEPWRAAETGAGYFLAALDKLGVAHEGIERLDVMSETFQERWLELAPDELAGVAEVASLLGVSKQRVSELRDRPGFPEPVAELAAGPVWRLPTLERFVAEWKRKPGRPARGKESA
ncbi:MAG: hypothetical protein WD757_06815 [Actinomycetota bacterium]